MGFREIKLFDNENIKKIRLSSYTWEELLGDKEILYKALCDLLLSEENLFYYTTQKESTKTLVDTKNYIKKLIEEDIIDSKIKDIFSTIGWKKGQIDINNTRFQGDLAEYLMCILLDKITNIDTIISKVALKTSPKMSSFGNDNIYYDYENKVLYYGESKFYNNISKAINRARESLAQHLNVEEFSYIRTHDNSIIAEDGIKRIKIIEELEEKSMEEINIKSVFFIANDDVYLKEDYESKIVEAFGTLKEINVKSAELIMVFLPILSKKEFLEYFKGRLNEFEE